MVDGMSNPMRHPTIAISVSAPDAIATAFFRNAVEAATLARFTADGRTLHLHALGMRINADSLRVEFAVVAIEQQKETPVPTESIVPVLTPEIERFLREGCGIQPDVGPLSGEAALTYRGPNGYATRVAYRTPFAGGKPVLYTRALQLGAEAWCKANPAPKPAPTPLERAKTAAAEHRAKIGLLTQTPICDALEALIEHLEAKT
jgi:hypothetical protein